MVRPSIANRSGDGTNFDHRWNDETYRSSAILATTPLPADVTVPIALDDVVFLPANKGTKNVVVDRATWTVAATPDYGREIGGSQMAYDGTSVYQIADGIDVLVVDGDSYELTDVIEPLNLVDAINARAVSPGALRVAAGDAGLERFDIPCSDSRLGPAAQLMHERTVMLLGPRPARRVARHPHRRRALITP